MHRLREVEGGEVSEFQWFEQVNEARFEPHTPETATPECKPDCCGHYVWEGMVGSPAFTIIRSLTDPAK